MSAYTAEEIVTAIGAAVHGETWWPIDAAYHVRNGNDPMEEVVLGAVLVQNTAWGQVVRALDALRARHACDLASVAALPLPTLTELVRPAGFVQRKPRTLQALAQAILDEGGLRLLRESVKDDPDPVQAMLLEVHGVGPETADSILLYALDAPVFVVDAYTRRLMHRLAIAPSPAHPDPLRAPNLVVSRWWRAGLPRTAAAYRHAHAAIVHHAQVVCRKTPRCGACPLESRCAFAASGQPAPERRGALSA